MYFGTFQQHQMLNFEHEILQHIYLINMNSSSYNLRPQIILKSFTPKLTLTRGQALFKAN